MALAIYSQWPNEQDSTGNFISRDSLPHQWAFFILVSFLSTYPWRKKSFIGEDLTFLRRILKLLSFFIMFFYLNRVKRLSYSLVWGIIHSKWASLLETTENFVFFWREKNDENFKVYVIFIETFLKIKLIFYKPSVWTLSVKIK